MAEEPRKDKGLSSSAAAMHEAEPYLSAAWRLVGGCAVGVIGGYFLDKWLGTGPWGLIVLSFLGICGGFYGLVTTLNALEKRKKALKK